MGKGVMGLAFKPVSGAVDMVSSTMAGVNAEMGAATKEHTRSRDPRHLLPSGVVDAYSQHRAMGARFIRDNFNGKYESDFYVSHITEEKDNLFRIYIALMYRFLIVESKDLQPGSSKTKIVQQFNPESVVSKRIVPSGLELQLIDHSTVLVKCSSADMARRIGQIVDQVSNADAIGLHKRDTIPALFPLRELIKPEDAQDGSPMKRVVSRQVHVIAVEENQRRYPLKGWSNSLLPTDRKHILLKDADGGYATLDEVPLSGGWKWCSEWVVDHTGDNDKDGWQYAIDWPRDFDKHKGVMDFVRRRTRTRQMTREVVDSSQKSNMFRPRVAHAPGGAADSTC